MIDTWQCDRCGRKTTEEDGEVFLAEWICIDGLRKDGYGACGGIVRKTPAVDMGVTK